MNCTTNNEGLIRVAGYIQDSIVDGPGFRFVVFTQGCERHCDGCHNPETWVLDGGNLMQVEELAEMMLSNALTDGLTLSGGEPFLQPKECALLANVAKNHRLVVWAYTGFTFEELMDLSQTDTSIMELLTVVDVLIDGAFELPLRSLNLKWRGSSNQRVLDIQNSLKAGIAVELRNYNEEITENKQLTQRGKFSNG